MKILLLCHEYPPLGGGGGVGAMQYARAWRQKGHKVRVITSWRPGLKFKEIENGIQIVRVFTIAGSDRARFSFIAMLSYLVVAFLHIWRHRSRYRRQHVINTHFALPGGILGLFASKILAIPNVLTIIGGDIYDPTKKSSPHRSKITRALNGFLLNSADKIIAISRDTKQNAKRYYKVRQEITVINYGFLPAGHESNGASTKAGRDGTYRLLAVGRLVDRKGFEYLIRAMPLLDDHVVLHIIGDGPLESKLRRLADQHGLNGRVHLIGYLPREKMWNFFEAADCFVLSSLHEGMGIVVQEAMHAGLPIVSTDHGGQVDLIKDGRNAILVKPKDPPALAEAIQRFYDDRQFADAVSKNNRDDVKRYYMDSNSEEYIKLFREAFEKAVGDHSEATRSAATNPAPEGFGSDPELRKTRRSEST